MFLHEGLGSIGQWKDFPETLSCMCRLPGLVYDRWGHGGSEALTEKRTPEYLHHEAFASLPDVLETCGIARAVLIGHSDGGSISLMFAAIHPENVLAVITEAAHVFVEDITVAGIREAVSAYEKTDLKLRLEKYHGPNTEAVFRGWSDTWLSPEFRNWNIEEYLPGVKCPLLAIQGQDDEYGSPAQVEAIVAQTTGASRGLMVPNCGHVPHVQAKQRVLAEMSSFISGIRAVYD